MKTALLALLILSPLAAGASDYSLKDEGDFVPAGRRVEFYDQYGWQNYKVSFDFGLDAGGKALSKESKLDLRITMRGGKVWNYSCRGRGRNALAANVNFLSGKGISIVAECKIDGEAFADAVGLHKDDVGMPNFVFQAVIQNGEVHPGAQRGLYFAPGGQIDSSELNAYAARDEDPSNLAVLFRSN